MLGTKYVSTEADMNNKMVMVGSLLKQQRDLLASTFPARLENFLHRKGRTIQQKRAMPGPCTPDLFFTATLHLITRAFNQAHSELSPHSFICFSHTKRTMRN